MAQKTLDSQKVYQVTRVAIRETQDLHRKVASDCCNQSSQV